jgi:hypothetical protein
MKFLLRLLLLLTLASFLLRHYGSFIRENLWRVQTTDSGAPLNQPLGSGPNHSQGQPAKANLPLGVFPRHDLTPGAIDPRVTQGNIRHTICRRGYTASVRPPFQYTNAMKHRLMRAYGATGSIHDYELDHLIPLELGGCPDCQANLWPQPRNVFPGAAEKDEVEDYLHHQVCSGVLPLAEAQREISSDWYAVYKRIHSHTTRQRREREQ